MRGGKNKGSLEELLAAETAAFQRRVTMMAEAANSSAKTGFNPAEPRVPAGNSDGGQWTGGGGGRSGGGQTGMGAGNQPPVGSGGTSPRNDHRSAPQKIRDAVTHLETNAKHHPDQHPQCAKYVREALNAGGYKVGIPPRRTGEQYAWAKDYSSELTRPDVGFHPVSSSIKPADYPSLDNTGRAYTPQKGDVVIINSTSTSKEGHIAMYNGDKWISDFKQKGFWPGSAYLSEKPGYIIYRPPSQ